MTIDWYYRRPRAVSVFRKGANASKSFFRSAESLGEDPDTKDSKSPLATSSRRSSTTRQGYCTPGIPDALSFDRIRDNKPATPCTLRDFMCYLLFVEHTVENMQFYTWYRDYCQRFGNLSETEKAMSPEYNPESGREGSDGLIWRGGSVRMTKPVGRTAIILEDELNRSVVSSKQGSQTGLDGGSVGGVPGTEAWEDPTDEKAGTGTKVVVRKVGPVPADYKDIAARAFQDADAMWQPFSVQPFRDEVSQVVALYLASNAPRELNISARDRQQTLHALAQTTHPSAFLPATRTAETFLRQQSHPNFIRWATSTGNQERFVLAHIVVISGTLSAVLTAILLTIAGVNRWWRLLSIIPLFVGVWVITAAYRGMCIVLHVEGHLCQLKPWEMLRFLKGGAGRDKSEVDVGVVEMGKNDGAIQPWDDDYSSDYSTEYEVELQKIPYYKRMFGPTKYCSDPALRDVQDSISAQSCLASIAVCICFACLFIPLPSGNRF